MARLIPRQIANAHTVFNVGLALLFVPFTVPFAKIIERLLPDLPGPEIEPAFQARHLEKGLLTTPTLALNLAKVEILRLGEIVKSMADRCIEPFLTRNLATCEELKKEEDRVDALDEQITEYLVAIGEQALSQEQAHEVYIMMHVTKQFEHVADLIDKQLCPLARKMVNENAEFSATGRKELEAYHLKMIKQISRALETFREGSLEKAKRMTRKMAAYIKLEERYRQAHFERIHAAVAESITSSEIHLELMDTLRRMSSNSTNVGRALMAKPTREKPGPGAGDHSSQ